MSPPRLDIDKVKVLDEIRPGDLWTPTTFTEWDAQIRLKAVLPAWSAQAEDERKLRVLCAWMIFSMAIFQTICGIGLLIALGLKFLLLDVDFIKILFTAVTAEVFGLFTLLAKFLFRTLQPPPATSALASADIKSGRKSSGK